MILDGMEGIWEGEWEGNKVEEGKENSREIQNRNVKKIEGKYGKNKKSNARNSDQNAIELEQEKFFENREVHQFAASLEPVRWLTSNEAAQYLRVSMSGLKTMIYRGQVRAHKLGRRNRFLKEELERLITLPHTRWEA